MPHSERLLTRIIKSGRQLCPRIVGSRSNHTGRECGCRSRGGLSERRGHETATHEKETGDAESAIGYSSHNLYFTASPRRLFRDRFAKCNDKSKRAPADIRRMPVSNGGGGET